MKTKYIDLIDQSFYFPQEEFKLNKNNLEFHGIDLMKLISKYGAPLKFTYLPKISDNINRAKHSITQSVRQSDIPDSAADMLLPLLSQSLAYRSRAVREPRSVLTEFGTELPDNVEVRVHDSTA